MSEHPSPPINEALGILALKLAFYISGFGQTCCYLHTERRDRIEELIQTLQPFFPNALPDFDRLATAAIEQHPTADQKGAMTIFLARLKHLSEFSDGALLSTQLIGDSHLDTPAPTFGSGRND